MKYSSFGEIEQGGRERKRECVGIVIQDTMVVVALLFGNLI